eukprot:gene17595-19348_t
MAAFCTLLLFSIGLAGTRAQQLTVRNPIPALNVSVCGYLEYRIPADTFHDDIDGDTRHLNLTLRNSSGIISKHHWVNFNSATQTIIALVHSHVFSSAEVTVNEYNFILTATTKRGVSISTNVSLVVSDRATRNSTVSLALTFAWVGSHSPPPVIILKVIFDRLAAYFNISVQSLRYAHVFEIRNVFAVKIVNCTEISTKCNQQSVSLLKSKLYNNMGTLPAFFSAMNPEIYVMYVQVSPTGPCTKRTVPTVQNKYPVITLSACATFSYRLPSVFYDEEDNYNLQLHVHAFDGIVPQDPEKIWATINTAENKIYGVITDEIVNKQPRDGYNLTIRAFDSTDLYADTSLILRINNPAPLKKYYQFTLYLSLIPERFLFETWEKFMVVGMLNGFLKGNNSNLVQWKKTGARSVSLAVSICSLSQRCDNVAAASIFNRMVLSGNTPQPEFAKVFSSRYILTAVTTFIDPICKLPMNPPVPLVNPWLVAATHCGVTEFQIPSGLFFDSEDGNARNLNIELLANNFKPLSKTSWLQINTTSRTIRGLPTTVDISAGKDHKLVATDRSGLNGSLTLRFFFSTPRPAKYVYTFVYRINRAWPDYVHEVSAFMRKIGHFLNDSSVMSSVAIVSYVVETTSVRRLVYENCSIPYNPCDITMHEKIRARLFSSTTQLSEGLKQALLPEFTIYMGRTENKDACVPGANTPPFVATAMPVLNVSVCGIFKMAVPIATFNDAESGNTRNLSLAMFDSAKRPLTSRSWLQFNASRQELTAVATVAIAEHRSRYSFILHAEDAGGLFTTYDLKIDLKGPFTLLKKCQLQMAFSVGASLKEKSNVYLASKIIQSMVSYFSLSSSSEIGVINVIRQSDTVLLFHWSYCSPKYQDASGLGSVASTTLPDAHGLATRILQKLFVVGTSTVNTGFKAVFSKLVVTSVKKVFSENCTSPPIPLYNQLVFNISSRGYSIIQIERNWFYDAEDGDAYSLRLKLLDEYRSEITATYSWINIDATWRRILVSVQDSQRDSSIKTYHFYLKAIDSSGKSADMAIIVNIIETHPGPLTPFSVRLEFVATQKITYLNDSIFISNAIATTYSLPKGSDVTIKSFREGNGYDYSMTFHWTTSSYHSCQSSVLKKTNDMRASNVLFNNYKQSFLPKFQLQRFSLTSSCGQPMTPPEVRVKSLLFKISMCSIWTHSLSSSMFTDTIDGDMRNMEIHLLNSSKLHVSASSWIQLNTATLRLYAIPSTAAQLHKSQSQFYIQATNSRGLKTHSSVHLNVSEAPYTSDCPVTLTVQRNFGTTRTVDLDVLNRLLRLISSYYQDSVIRIKVLKFTQLSTYTYELKYSNCSFTFATKEAAQRGHDGDQRASISALFSRVVTPSRAVQSSFAAHLSKVFTVKRVNVSYDCIQAPPYPTGAASREAHANVCAEFRDLLPTALFNDAQDGTNLKYTLTYASGKTVAPNDWLMYDSSRHEVRGMVAVNVKKNAPLFGYKYLIIATDSSGRSANISYAVKILGALPNSRITFYLGFKSAFADNTASASALLNISRSIAGYLNGDSSADKILIHSYNPWKSIVFGLCSMLCSETEYLKKAKKLQKIVHKSEPYQLFVNAAHGTFVPKCIYVYGPTCLSPSITTITVYRQRITINQPVCGFLDYQIPSNVFADAAGGRTTRDFLLTAFDKNGIQLRTSSFGSGGFQFDSANQQLYGTIVTSSIVKSSLNFELRARHPQSGRSASSILTVDIPEYEKLKAVSSTLCVVNVTVTTAINPAYSDAFILKRFSTVTAGYLGGVYQQMQIKSYTRSSSSYPVQLSISFSNCTWYSTLSSLFSQSSISKYTETLRSSLNMLLIKSNSGAFTYNHQYFNALHKEFNLLSISASNWCFQPPNLPPKVNTTISIITVMQCTRFAYEIPEFAFSDEDGNSRNLSLQLYDANGNALAASSWVSFNTITQTIHGKPTRQAYLSQTQGGYKFLLKANDRYGLAKTVDILIRISSTGTAPSNEPPKIILSNYKLTVPSCGVFRRSLSDGFATDKEDGSTKNLSIAMKMHDGSDIPANSWIQFDSATHEIVALPRVAVASSSSTMSWMYRIVVNDSCGGMASSSIKISTQRQMPSFYSHQFTFQSLLPNSTLDLYIYEMFLVKVAEFFKETSKQYQVINFSKNSTNQYFVLRFSNCTITEYICPNVHQSSTLTQAVFKSSTHSLTSFSSFMSTWFRLLSYQNQTRYHVYAAPTLNPFTVTSMRVTSCGRYLRDVSSMFVSRNSLLYSMTLADGSPIPSTHPIQLINKTLYVIPLGNRDNGKYSFQLTSTDLCRQSTSTILNIVISVAQKSPGYALKFQSTVQSSYPSVYYVSRFTDALQSHLNSPSFQIYVSSYSRVQNTMQFVWQACSESFCNTTDVIRLRKSLFVTGNITDYVLLSRLNQTFIDPQIIEENNCNFTSPRVPTRNSSIVRISVNLCRKLSFAVPLSAFHDHEDGFTSALHVSLLTKQRDIIPINNWLQFNRVAQTIYGYPRFSSTVALQQQFEYTLLAKDIQGNAATSRLIASIVGTTPTITYKLTMHGRINSHHIQPHVDYEIELIQRIGRFFGDHSINDVSFSKQGQSFFFTWSFCSMRADKCDCQRIKRTESMLTPIENFQKAMQPPFTVSYVNSVRLGVCARPGGPQRLIDKTEIQVQPGQTFSYYVQNHHFYDYEDGYTQNLTLFISNYQKQQLMSSSWIKVQNQHICGLAVLSQVQNQEWSSTRREYNLVARDACGMESTDMFTIRMNAYRGHIGYKILVYVTDYFNEIPTNCNKMESFVSKISTYLNMNSSVIYIYNIAPSNRSYSNSTVITWSMTNFSDCDSKAVKSVRERLVYDNGTVTREFVEYMKNDFNVTHVGSDNSSCIILPGAFILPPPTGTPPWWILILILILAILFLFCWLCWLCIPRCCAVCCAACLNGCCNSCNRGCAKCCMPGGKYASLDSRSVPGLEAGVLSKAKGEQLIDNDKLAQEAEAEGEETPDDGKDMDGNVLAAPAIPDSSGYDSSPNASKIDEDEMKLMPGAVPSYSAPVYLGTDSEDDNSFLQTVASDDDNAPNDNFDSGVAAMPRGDPSASAVAPMYNDDFSSLASTTDDTIAGPTAGTFAGTSAAPFVDNEVMLQRTEVQRSFQQSGFNFDDNLDLHSAPHDDEVGEFAAAPAFQEPAQQARSTLALPQTPNIFSPNGGRIATRERRLVTTNELSPVITSESVTRTFETIEKGRKNSVVVPVQLHMPEHGPASTVEDVMLTERDSNEWTESNLNRRISQANNSTTTTTAASRSQIINEQMENRSQPIAELRNTMAGARRKSQTHEYTANGSIGSRDNRDVVESVQQYKQEPKLESAPAQLQFADAPQYATRSDVSNNRRVSVVRLVGDSSMREVASQPAPVQLRFVEGNSAASRDGRSQVERQNGGRKFSILNKDGTVTALKNVKIVSGKSSSTRSSSDTFESAHGVYEPNRRKIVKLRRSSLSSRISDSQLGYDGDRHAAVQTSLGMNHIRGYESDSTDSGYVISQTSMRHKRNKSSVSRLFDGPGHGPQGIRTANEWNVRRVSRHSRRSSRDPNARITRDIEMWSNDATGFGNQGYESDSYV